MGKAGKCGIFFIYIDEVSNIALHQLADISEKLTRATKANSSIPFGGLDMIFFGDFIQFPPIGGNPLYHNWNLELPIHGKVTPKEVREYISRTMWKNLTHIVLLDEQMRIQDEAYQGILNRLREGKCTDDDIAVLNTRVIENNVNLTSLSGDPIITPGNELGMSINNLFAHEHSLNKTVYLTTAIDSCKGNLPRDVAHTVKKNYKEIDEQRRSQLQQELMREDEDARKQMSRSRNPKQAEPVRRYPYTSLTNFYPTGPISPWSEDTKKKPKKVYKYY